MSSFRAHHGSSPDIGTFSVLTNTYCLVPTLHPQHVEYYSHSNNLYNVLESEIGDVVPIIPTTVANTRLVGTMVAGNSRGVLLPDNTTESELNLIGNSVPDGVQVRRVEGEKLNALGNVVVCNDHVAVVNQDMSAESIECISDVLAVEVFRVPIATEPESVDEEPTFDDDGDWLQNDDQSILVASSPSLIGAALVLNNIGGVISPSIPLSVRLQLEAFLDMPIAPATVNNRKHQLGAGIVANDWLAVVGTATWGDEIQVIESAFGLAEVFHGTGLKRPHVLRHTGIAEQERRRMVVSNEF